MSEQKYHQVLTANRKLLAENERLEANVKRLTSIIDINTDDKGRNLLALTNENARLAADIKRLAADTLKDLSLIEELKAEVEHLGAFRTHTIIPNEILQAENTRLKAEVERSTTQYNGIIDTQLKVIDELKAEVGRLTEERCFLNERLNHFVKQTVQNREQVERLRKAGDAMVEIVKGTYCIDKPSALIAWNAAKEGRPNE